MASDARVVRRLALLAALVALPVAGCGGGDDDVATGPEGPVTSLTITSTDLSFDIEAFEVPVGEEVTVTYENEHEGVPHNLHVDTGGPDEPTTEVVDGPVTQELTFTLDEAGEVPYVCDVHPATMRGTITASEPGTAGA
jgi:plastocyanin